MSHGLVKDGGKEFPVFSDGHVQWQVLVQFDFFCHLDIVDELLFDDIVDNAQGPDKTVGPSQGNQFDTFSRILTMT